MRCSTTPLIMLLATVAPAAAQEVASDGTPRTFTLDADHAPTAAWVEVPEGSQRLTVELEGNFGEVLLAVRHGEPFDFSAPLRPQVDFWSVGPGRFQHVTITGASSPGLEAGRWYLLPLNFNDSTAQLTVTARASDDPELDPIVLEAVYDSEEQDMQTGFFDPEPYSSPHNPAETVGEARRLAFERALDIAAGELTQAGATSPISFAVGARFEDLGDRDEDDRITLAQAGPGGFWLDFFGAYENDTIYPISLTAKQAGTDICRVEFFHVPPEDDDGSFEPLYTCDTPYVFTAFNTSEDIEWSYALEPVSNPADFVSVAMHEIMHGLGFLSTFRLEDDEEEGLEAGEMLIDLPDVYTRNLIFLDGENETFLPDLDNAGRVDAATSTDGLRWFGKAVMESPNNLFTGLNELFRMYAPSTVEPGSSVSHVDTRQPVAASELMRPRTTGVSPRNLGNTAAFMLDLGWGRQALGSAGHPIHFGMTGLWYNPDTSGQGFLFDIAATQNPPQATAFWFTFDDQAGGPGSQRWYTAQGDYSDGDSSVAMTVYMTTGGAFDRRPPVPETTPVGEMTLAFQSCTEATLSYDFDLDNDPGKRVQGTMPVSRISPDVYCKTGMHPDEFPIASPPAPVVLDPVLNGSWYEPATSGQGLLFEVVEDQDPPQLVALWFTFAEDTGGAQGQRWFIAQGDYTPGAREVTLDVRMSLGGEFDRRPPAPELVTVGTAEVEFESCTEAEFEYDINLDNVPGEGTEGRIALRRLTPDILCHKRFR